MENVTNTQNAPKVYRRKDRSVSLQTRQKISQALTGRPKSIQHRQAISNALKNDYWPKIPHASQDANKNSTDGWESTM